MKRLFFIALTLLCLNITLSFAEIRNAYDHQLVQAKKCITDYNALLNKELKPEQRQRLELLLENAQEKYDEYKILQKKTDELLLLFRYIDPSLYREIDGIEDFLGNETHVYIRLVEKIGTDIKGIMIKGSTNLEQLESNAHEYLSEYGRNTVSIKISDSGPIIKNIYALIHEVGHVKYQVPNLNEYISIYNELYEENENLMNGLGHHSADPSHMSVSRTIEQFKKSIKKVNWKTYLSEIRDGNIHILADAKN